MISELQKWEVGANEEQLEVIRHGEGPARVLSCAGSGKTFSVVRRVAALISTGVDPERIFCVTFSKKGAQEMDSRLRKLGIRDCSVQTWHAFCLRVIREEGLPEAGWEVDTKDAEKTLLRRILGWDPETKRVYWQGANLTRFRRYLGFCKANLIEANSDEAVVEAKRLFGYQWALAVGAYKIRERRVAEQGLLTFDDFLVVVARLFNSNEDARCRWASKFDHIMTDECQDNNRVQVELSRHLARDHRNLTVVGDLFQAIYAFRGSKPDYLAQFRGEWDARDISMVRNYRSATKIIAVANAVVSQSSVGEDRPLQMVVAREGAGEGSARLVSAANFDDEASEVATWVKASVEGGADYSDHCVLYRLNAQSRALEDALLREQIPYQIIGGICFWQRKEVKDLLAYLRVAAGRDDDGDGVKRCINAPFRFLGTAFVERLMKAREDEPDLTWTQLVTHVANQAGLWTKQRDSAVEWSRMMADVGEMIRGEDDGCKTPADILKHVVSATKYLKWLEESEGEESIEASHCANVREMIRVASSFKTVGDLLDYIDENLRDTDRARRQRGDKVTLMTVHKSKGLEFPKVWVVGFNEKILPHAMGDIEEERRLAYVAITRARDEVVCSHVGSYSTKADGVQKGELSSFLSPPEVRSLFEEAGRQPEDVPANSSSRVEIRYEDTLDMKVVLPPRMTPPGEENVDAKYDRLEEEMSTPGCKVVFLDSYRQAGGAR